MFLVERPRINEEHMLLCAAVPHYISDDLPNFTFYSRRLKIHLFFLHKLMLFIPKCLGFKLQVR